MRLSDLLQNLDVLSFTEHSNMICELCRKQGIAGYIFNVSYQEKVTTIALCNDCTKQFENLLGSGVRGHLFVSESKKLASEAFSSWKLSDADIITDLQIRHPEFWRALIEFSAGNFTLEDGSDDEILRSISDQLDGGYSLSDKQIALFKSRCDYYVRRKSTGKPLRQPEKSRSSGEAVQSLLDELLKFGMKSRDKEMTKDIARFFAGRGYVTEPQFEVLQRLAQIYGNA